MRKPAFCICENKDADQLRGNYLNKILFKPIVSCVFFRLVLYEPRRENTGFLHMRKQRRRSASRSRS